MTRNNVFEFDGEFYLQTREIPMGNTIALLHTVASSWEKIQIPKNKLRRNKLTLDQNRN